MDALAGIKYQISTIPRHVQIELETRVRGAPLPAPRAHGGPVRRRWPYIVGEEGPEFFVPKLAGFVVNMRQAAEAVARLRDVPRQTRTALLPMATGTDSRSGATVDITLEQNFYGPTDPGRVGRATGDVLERVRRELRMRLS